MGEMRGVCEGVRGEGGMSIARSTSTYRMNEEGVRVRRGIGVCEEGEKVRIGVSGGRNRVGIW